MKIKKKFIFLIIIAVVATGFIVYQIFFKKEKSDFTLEKVVRATIVKEVSETGTVKISDETNLAFNSSGRIEKIYVKVGDEAVRNQKLAEIDNSQLFIELTEAQATSEVAQADYNKLLAGSSLEEIKIAKTDVLSAQVSLDSSRQKLIDVKDGADEDLKQAYEDASSDLNDSYSKIYNALNVVNSIQLSYYNAGDQEGIKVRENKAEIRADFDKAKSIFDNIKDSSQYGKIDAGLIDYENLLSDVGASLKTIRDMAETINYQSVVSSADKTSLDNQKSYINTACVNIIGAKQVISNVKIVNTSSINIAKVNVLTAETNLQKYQDVLSLKEAGPRQEDINLYSARIKQARAKVSILQNQIEEAVLKSPNSGKITRINKREGEMAQPTEAIISFLPNKPFQIEVDIYEEEIVNIEPGDIVKVVLAAFPEETLGAKMAFIDPAEKIIDGVVYYKTTIYFDEIKQGIKQGMTADVIIESDKKENVIAVPKEAVKKNDGERTIQVFKDGKIQERKIEVGLIGNELIEVISGLSEGEQIVISKKP